MPTAEEHQQKAEHNFRFLETIDGDEFPDWLVVAAFYTAVHLVEKLRADLDQHSLDHADRNHFVREQHPPIHVFYRELFNLSLLARYSATPLHWLLPERVTDCLDEIQQYVNENSR